MIKQTKRQFALWPTSIQTANGSFVSLRIWFYFSIFNILLGATCPLGASRLKQTAISFPSVLIRVKRQSSQNAFYFSGIHDKRRWSNQTAFSLPRAHDKSEDHVKRLNSLPTVYNERWDHQVKLPPTFHAFMTRGDHQVKQLLAVSLLSLQKSTDQVKWLPASQAFVHDKSNCHQLLRHSWQEVAIKSNNHQFIKQGFSTKGEDHVKQLPASQMFMTRGDHQVKLPLAISLPSSLQKVKRSR